MRPRILVSLAVSLGFIPLFANCRDATQMIVVVTTDVPCPQFSGTSITVGTLDTLQGKNATTVAPSCTSVGAGLATVGQLVITPSGDNDEEVAFQVATGIGVDPTTCSGTAASPKCIVARRQLRFIPHETVRVEVPMREVCANVSCDPQSTCFSGSCTSAAIDSSKCAGGVCAESQLGAGTSGGGDAGTDGGAGTEGGAPIAASDTQIVWGDDHGCLLRNGNVFCFGTNGNGQLGNGTVGGDNATPTLVAGLAEVASITSSQTTVGALKKDGTVWMWGDPGLGHIPGSPNTGNVTTPFQIRDALAFTQFCSGHSHACGISGKQVQCWGTVDDPGHAEDPELQTVTTQDIVGVGCGNEFTVLRLADGSMMSFGQAGTPDSTLLLGRGPNATKGLVPTAINGLTGMTSSVTVGENTFAIGPSGTFAWGANRGALINQVFDGFDTPQKLTAPFSGYSQIGIGYLFACGLRGTDVECWGDNSLGQLGQGKIGANNQGLPLKVALPKPAKGIWAGSSSACAELTDGTIQCWGENDHGQLGIGTTEATHPTPSPMKLSQN